MPPRKFSRPLPPMPRDRSACCTCLTRLQRDQLKINFQRDYKNLTWFCSLLCAYTYTKAQALPRDLVHEAKSHNTEWPPGPPNHDQCWWCWKGLPKTDYQVTFQRSVWARQRFCCLGCATAWANHFQTEFMKLLKPVNYRRPKD